MCLIPDMPEIPKPPPPPAVAPQGLGSPEDSTVAKPKGLSQLRIGNTRPGAPKPPSQGAAPAPAAAPAVAPGSAMAPSSLSIRPASGSGSTGRMAQR